GGPGGGVAERLQGSRLVPGAENGRTVVGPPGRQRRPALPPRGRSALLLRRPRQGVNTLVAQVWRPGPPATTGLQTWATRQVIRHPQGFPMLTIFGKAHRNGGLP